MQNPEYIPLDLIDQNPYQTRLMDDPDHVTRVAESIRARGLLQAPMGRRHDGRVQLAFGHTRLAAYIRLNNEMITSPAAELTPIERLQYAYLPVILQDLSDEDMFELAVRENNDRKNLNPIETARAMLRYREDFGKTSAEIGALFGLSESAVRNKMRLLKLPGDIQTALMREEITEGCSRALIALYDLPEEVRQVAGQEQFPSEIRPSEIIRDALGGSSPDVIAQRINKLERWSVLLAEPQIEKSMPVNNESMDSSNQDQAAPEWMKNFESKTQEEPVNEPEPIEVAPASSETAAPAPEPVRSGSAHVDADELDADEDQEETEEEPAIVPEEPAPLSSTAEPVSTGPAAETSEPAAAPAGPLSWLESTIVLTYTFYPDDGNEFGREVIVGARINDQAPKLHFTRAANILPKRLADIYVEFQNQIGQNQIGG